MAKIDVACLTGNAGKMAEYARILGRYGVRPRQVAPDGDLAWQASRLLAEGATYVLREESRLVDGRDATISDLSLARVARHESRLLAYAADGFREEVARVRGFLDPSRAQASPGRGWFGWDDVFVQADTGLTYREAADLGLKSSARDEVFGRFARDRLSFDSLTDLRHDPVAPARAVDLGRPVLDFMLRDPVVAAAVAGAPGGTVERLMASVIQGGTFFRAATSRRDRNFWMPGLNGGIPLTPKADEVHERTFMMHDLMHWASPDLVFDGDASRTGRMAYVLHRMVGEAVSMVVADHAFAEGLLRGRVEYDFGKRFIHPLFASMDPDGAALSDSCALRRLARANVRLALVDDAGPALALGADPSALAAFRGKYVRFFVEDYRWTGRNHAAMADAERANGMFSAWSRGAQPVLDALRVRTVSEFVAANGLDGLDAMPFGDAVDAVFDATWDTFVAPRFDGSLRSLADVDGTLATDMAFRRYMAGQSAMCWRYRHVPGVARVGEAILDALPAASGGADRERVAGLHGAAVDMLRRASAISEEDARTYRDVAPAFEPFFVFYDSRSAPLATIAEAVGEVFPGMVAPAGAGMPS